MEKLYKIITFIDKTTSLLLLLWSPFISYNSFYHLELHNKKFYSCYFGILNIFIYIFLKYIISFYDVKQSLIYKIFEFTLLFIFFIQFIIWSLQFFEKDNYVFVYLFHDYHFLLLLENLRFFSILVFIFFYWILYKKIPGEESRKKLIKDKIK